MDRNTLRNATANTFTLSPSSRGRGSKPAISWFDNFSRRCRPLHEGVDRNAGVSTGGNTLGSSPSSRGRGSKRANRQRAHIVSPSPSSRGRGSKQRHAGLVSGDAAVALFTRAWIETTPGRMGRPKSEVALFTRAWIETPSPSHCSARRARRPLHEGVDRNFAFRPQRRERIGRPLHEGVDRNLDGVFRAAGLAVALFTRAWIETVTWSRRRHRRRVALFTRAWIETRGPQSSAPVCPVALFTRAWIETTSM